MESFNDIQTLWHSDSGANIPQMSEIKNVIIAHSKNMKQRNRLVIFLLLCCVAALIVLITVAPFTLWTTYFGLCIFMGVAIYTIRFKVKKQHTFSHPETLANSEFLNALEIKKDQACTGKSRKMAILFSVWAVGFFFYIYEFVFTNTTWLLIGYGLLTGLILFMWFVYRPFMRKQYQKRIQKTIEKIHHLKTQLYEKE